MASTLPQRNEVPAADQWDVESVYPSEHAFEEAFARADAEIPSLRRFEGTLGQSATHLLEALKAREAVGLTINRLYLYASMMQAGDTTDSDNLARADRTDSLEARFSAAVSYIQPELLAVAPEALDRFLHVEPGLTPYAHYLEQLSLLRGHVRSAEIEALLAEAGDVTSSPSRIHSALENADMTFTAIKDDDGQDVQLAQGNSTHLITSPIRSVRRDAWQGYADGYLKLKNTFAASLAGSVKRDVFYARAHHYESALQATMRPNNLPESVFHNLITTVRAHLPLWHRYWDIRKRALGVERLHPYDLHVPLATSEESIPFSRAIDILSEGLAPLGTEYIAAMRRGLTIERWVDKYPNVGKGAGAFSTGAYGTRPFIMQNYNDTLLSLSTLAHELGHSLHTWLTWQNQPPIYENYSMFVAETASNFNQALLRPHLLKQSDDRRFQIAVIEEGMSNFKRYLFIMPILAQFELDAHQRVERGEALSAHSMSAKIADLYREGYGDGVEFDTDRVGITWAQFSHLYVSFYVYQYATGISAANALADAVLKEGAPAAERYLSFLKVGNARFPLDALTVAGVDMTTPAPIERAFTVLEGFVDQLDDLVGDGPLLWLPRPDC